MNTLNATGWLQKDAWKATVPVTFKQIVLFDIYLANDDGVDGIEPAPWRCEVTNLADIQRHEAKLVAGAALIIRGELRAVPFIQHGIHKGFARFIAVDRLEFSRLPERALAAAAPAEAQPAEAPTA